jgi:hypothetical protein
MNWEEQLEQDWEVFGDDDDDSSDDYDSDDDN